MVYQPSFVIVTETDYVTVTPTAVTLPTSLLTDLTLSSDATTSSYLASMSSTRASAPMIQQESPTMHTSSSMPTSHTSLPALPSEFASPIKHKPRFNDTFAIIVLTAVIILGLVLFGMIGYMIYLRCKGQCVKCKTMEEQLAKWERGDLKCITREMVRKRENGNREPSPEAIVDLEKGADSTARDHQGDTRRIAPAADVQGKKITRPFWNRAMGLVNAAKETLLVRSEGKNTCESEKNISPPIHTRASAIVEDRYFTMQIDSPSTTHDNPPSPSLYSQPTVIGAGPRTFTDHSAPSMPRSSRLRQDSAQLPTRYTAYGATVEDVTGGGEDNAGSSVVSYQPAIWRSAVQAHADGFF